MKVKKDIWLVEVATYYGNDKMLTSDTEVCHSKEEAEKSLTAWLNGDDYAKRPEKEDGSFPNRIFELKVNKGNLGGTLERVTNVPKEYFFRRIDIVHETIEIDVPLVFDINDIKQIQLIMK